MAEGALSAVLCINGTPSNSLPTETVSLDYDSARTIGRCVKWNRQSQAVGDLSIWYN